MKRKRQSWATRPLPPVTLARVEQMLDTLAYIVDRWPDLADHAVHLWRRLERERDAMKDTNAIIAQARARALRLREA